MAATRGAYGATGDEHKLAGADELSLSATPRSDSGWRKVVGGAIALLALTCTVGATVSLAQRRSAPLELSTSEGMSMGAGVGPSASSTASASSTTSESSTATASTGTTLGLLVQTEGYRPVKAVEQGLYPWTHIAEPHRVTLLQALGGETDSDFVWQITYQIPSTRQGDHSEPAIVVSEVRGQTINATFKHAATVYDVRVDEYRKGGSSDSMSTTIMCKYVRRELRQLRTEDREEYFEAMEIVAKTSMQDGQMLYGEKFYNFEEFTIKHVHTQACSPFHGGLSFLTSHAAFTLQLDQALQSINPKITQPYWDYTKDALVYGNEWDQSHVWDDDWFGSAKPKTTDHRLEGRFAGTPVPTNMSRPVHNSYGRITSTVNNDPTKYTTRANEFCGLPVDMPLPGCKEMIGCLDTDNLVDFHSCAESYLHGDLHAIFGGVWDCPYSIKPVIEAMPHLDKLLGNIGCKAKSLYTTLWNERIMVCPDTCSDDTPFSECSCVCPLLRDGDLTFDKKYDLITGGNNAEPGNDLLLKYIHHKYLDREELYVNGSSAGHVWTFTNATTEENEFLIEWFLNFSCHPGKLGAMSTAASANDPIFWPLHPIFDRLWAFLRVAPEFSHFNHTWVDTQSCQGHDYHDIMPFKDLLGEHSGHYYTNQELYQLFDPSSPTLPYMYDNFDWGHCHTATNGHDDLSSELTEAELFISGEEIYRRYMALQPNL